MSIYCNVLIGIYIVAAIAALAIIPLNAEGIIGTPDPLSGIFAILLAPPWIWLISPLASDAGTAWAMAVTAACMALNTVIMWFVCAWMTRRASPKADH